MKSLYIYFLFLFFLNINKNKAQSEEYYECLSPEKDAISPYDCISVKIPEKDGFTCCSMKVTFGTKTSYKCFPLENEYINNKTLFELYVSSKKNLGYFFADSEGEIEIECRNDTIKAENFEKYSDEYLNCYNYSLIGVENENSCFQNDIPVKDGSKCCYLESYQINPDGNIKEDKRCYPIPNEYLTKNKTLKNYLMEATNLETLDYICNTNITIKCNNYEKYELKTMTIFNQTNVLLNNRNQTTILNNDLTQILTTIPIIESYVIDSTIIQSNNNNDNNRKSSSDENGVKAWVIILIIIGSLILIGAIIAIIICVNRKKSNSKKIDLQNKENAYTYTNIKINN